MKSAKNLRRYHYKVYFHPWNILGGMLIEFFTALPKVDVTHHAAEQLMSDKRGIIPLPSKKELMKSENQLIEYYEILNKKGEVTHKIQKVVIRVSSLSTKYDYAYVIAREGYCVSSWALDKNDEHRLTHSLKEYYCPENEIDAIHTRLLKEQEEYKKIERKNDSKANNKQLVVSK